MLQLRPVLGGQLQNIVITLLTSRGGNRGPKARPIRRHMAMFISAHFDQILLYLLMSRS